MRKERIAVILLVASMMTTVQLLLPVEAKESGREITIFSTKDKADEIIKNIYTYRDELEEQRQIEEQKRIEKERKLEEERLRKEQEKNRIYCIFEVSFYTASADECGNNNGIGASGEKVQPWVSIALPKDIPFYSTATIEGLGTFINHDTGSYIQWTDDGVCRVDICVSTKEEAINLGRYRVEGYIDIKRGE